MSVTSDTPKGAIRFASMITEAESLDGDARRDALRSIATGFFRKYAVEYVTSRGPLADELAAHLPANDLAASNTVVENAGQTVSTPKPPAKSATAGTKKPPKEFLEPEIKATKRTAKALSDAIAAWRSDVALANTLAAEIGASLTGGMISDLEAEGLIDALHKKTRITKKTIKAHAAKARPRPNPEYETWFNENHHEGWEFLPKNVFACSDGTFSLRSGAGKDVRWDEICGVFRVVGRTRNPDSSDWGLVIVFPDPKTKEIKEVTVYNEEMVRDRGELVGRLGREGLSIFVGQEEFGKFLMHITHKVNKWIMTFDRTGWHWTKNDAENEGEGKKLAFFVTPVGEIIAVAENNGDEVHRLRRGIGFKSDGASGDIDGWKAAVEKLAKANEHWALGVAMGLAGPVLQAAGMDSCGANLSGHSSFGKTTAQRIAASAWTHTGEDRSKRGLVRVMKATENSIENMAEPATGTVLLLDELENIKDKATLSQTVMTLAGGEGRARQGRTGELRRTAAWTTHYVMSSEVPARTLVEETGKKKWVSGLTARLVDIDCNEAKIVDPLDLTRWRRDLNANHGHAGPAFVRALIGSGELDDLPALRKKIVTRAVEIAGDEKNPVLGRAAEVFALWSVTGDLAERLGIITPDTAGYVSGAVDAAWLRFVAGHDAAASDPRAEALEILVAELNGRRGLDVLPVEPPTDRDGNERQKHRDAVAWYDEGKSLIYVRKDKLADLTKARISVTAILKHLEAEGVLIREQADRYHWRSTPKNGDTHSYRLNSDVLGFAGDDEDDDAPASAVKRGDAGERTG